MLPPLPNVPSTSATRAAAPIGFWKLAAVGSPHIAALGLMLKTETEFGGRAAFLLFWLLLNSLIAVLLRRPALSGALALTLTVILVLLSRLKHDVVQMTVNFVDIMLIDQDSTAFLFAIFPKLKGPVVVALIVLVPLMIALWRLDPFRIRRLPALAAACASLAGLAAFGNVLPEEDWRIYNSDSYVSKFALSGVTSVSDFASGGFMASAAATPERLKIPLEDSCQPAARRPHIIMIHDESSYDIRSAPQIKVPEGYGRHFVSSDGKTRKFVAESNGGSSWLTEYNVLTGLSSRSFGRFGYFVTRIAAGRVERGLPMALRRCGYSTATLYPAYGAFMSARNFHTTTGIDKFYDARDLGANGLEPDRFFYDKAQHLLAERKAGAPMFIFVYLGANHFPWATRFRADLTPGWTPPGNDPAIDEYVRRQTMSATDYQSFVAQLKKQFPAEQFLIVRYGDHQPEFSYHIIEPQLSEGDIAKKLMAYDPLYYATYYAIDGVNFKPAATPTAMDMIDAAYLPLVIQEAAGLPLDASFEEQKKIMLRCKGVFFGCKSGAEASRLNRLLIDAGIVKNL